MRFSTAVLGRDWRVRGLWRMMRAVLSRSVGRFISQCSLMG